MKSHSRRILLGFVVALAACCQAESFAVNSRVMHYRTKQRENHHVLPSIMHANVFARLRGGQVSSSAKSLFEGAAAVPSGALAGSLATVLHSFVDPAIAGGFLSGGLHAITGPDHLAALIAPTVGKSGFHGLQIGALWGVGHGFTAILLGLCAYFLKGQFTGRFAVMEKLSTLAESVVGVSILFIGIMGIKESREAVDDEKEGDRHHHHHHHDGHHHAHHGHHHSHPQQTVLLAGGSSDVVLTTATVPIVADTNSSNFDAKKKKTPAKKTTNRAVLANGMLHGFSWDGAPSLAPAITMATWQGALSFLAAYSLGTIVAMSVAAGAVGELSTRVGKASSNPDLPRKLSFVSSMTAVAIGLYLTTKSVLGRYI